ncbi:hypothetical protein LSH36_200g04073 [Paralvinella palmiformis]|uniref:G-protein coupled receptors family 1 profile domain-containing protein n=1 Tax=Paralvinella palmiformis TaxID=53620 RepID=A0AAD9JR32_9ANNE|nr:hypothetical protein LSH36_200g04073 [Paralvinella palmiformis]
MDGPANTTEGEASVVQPTQRSVQQWTEFNLALLLVKYVTISLIVTGTIGNLLSFIVLVRRRIRKNSINIYLAILACADTVVLYISAFKTWLRVITGFELLHVSNVGCKITIFMFMLASHMSAWLIVLVTMDRFIAVRFPFRAVQICTTKRSALATAILLCVLVLYNAHLLWTMHLHEFENGYKQCAPQIGDAFMNGPFNYIRLASYTLVPFTLVITMNIGIIVGICRTSAHSLIGDTSSHLKLKGSTCTKNAQQNKYQVTIMLLVVSFSWLLLTLPYTVMSLINFDYSTSRTRAVAFLLKTISFLLMYLNHSCNFFLYCLAGKKFRTEFISMFHDCRMSLQRRRSEVFSLRERTPLTFDRNKPVSDGVNKVPKASVKLCRSGRSDVCF